MLADSWYMSVPFRGGRNGPPDQVMLLADEINRVGLVRSANACPSHSEERNPAYPPRMKP